ncbi:PspC domain-containing protein [Sphingomonas arenae]|uniref:PspC domain-containing protein n=1 Tax=Sphingomonas arenae TaxID=2812555 RepID=UPI0019684573|nr:PspC domain-containing protein [Sphingomonas arenae]
MDKRFHLNRRDAKLMGVGAGLADHFNIDPLLTRLGLVVLAVVTFPVGVLLYILTGWLASDR